MSYALPPTGLAASPQCVDLASCRRWIERLPLGQTALAQMQLLAELRLLNAYPLPAAVRLDMLEALQTPVRRVQGERLGQFAGRPLPLEAPEQAAADATHALWRELLLGYLRCLEALRQGDARLKPCAALVCQRALALLADGYCDLVRAGRGADRAFWACAHSLYATAEQFGVARAKASDALRDGGAHAPVEATPEAAYAELILLAAAGLHELPLPRQTWVCAWARRWAGKLEARSAPPELKSALPLCVDLDGDSPPGFLPHSGAGARWFATDALRLSLKRRSALLRRGDPADTPERLGLGAVAAPAALAVLDRLYPRWVKGGVQRRSERHPAGGVCRLVAGDEAIHYYVSGHQSFRPPGSTNSDELRRQREELALFGRIAPRIEEGYSEERGYRREEWTAVEEWGKVDRSDDGVCLVRPLAAPGRRLGGGQLVAAQPEPPARMRLGAVRWMQQRDALLVVGIELFPGTPEPVGVRRTGVQASPDPYRRGFLLVAAPSEPAVLILPLDLYKRDRILEVWTPMATRRFKLVELLERGADFERAHCIEPG